MWSGQLDQLCKVRTRPVSQSKANSHGFYLHFLLQPVPKKIPIHFPLSDLWLDYPFYNPIFGDSTWTSSVTYDLLTFFSHFFPTDWAWTYECKISRFYIIFPSFVLNLWLQLLTYFFVGKLYAFIIILQLFYELWQGAFFHTSFNILSCS